MEQQIEIINNEEKQHFEVELAGEFAYTEYRWYKGTLALMHTFVPEKARGKGISALLAKFALEYAHEKNLKIMVYCSSVAKYMKEHPGYEFLIDKRYHQ